MVSEIKGAVSEIKKEAINAVHCPCYNHALNLSISKASQVQCVRNTIGTIKEIISFFSVSSKRNFVLKKTLGKQLSGLCETRWIERHDAVIQFRGSFQRIANALDTISKWNEIQSAAKAKIMLLGLCDSTFIITVVCLADILSDTLPLSRSLQKPTIDLKFARDMLCDTLSVLDNKRKNCDNFFNELFAESCDIASELGVDIKMPRRTKSQVHRNNFSTSSPSEYYKISIYIPIIEHIVEDLRTRFREDTFHLYNLSAFLPKSKEDGSMENVNTVSKFYNSFPGREFLSEKILLGEMRSWQAKWKREKEMHNSLPVSALNALTACDRDIYPNIHFFLKILCTLPVSGASAERSFSALRRLKTWLRSTMADQRLTGLALLHVHNHINVDVGKVIDRFANNRKRRTEFVL